MNFEKPSCEQARELAALAPSGDLTPVELCALDMHLGTCAECREAANALEALYGQLSTMQNVQVPDYAYASVRTKVMAGIKIPRRPGWLAAWPAFAAALACTVALVALLQPRLPVETASRPSASQAPVEVASVDSPAPSFTAASPRKPRPVVTRQKSQQSTEPLVVQMFTDDPDVVIYWIADASPNRSEKETIQ
jgi:anti-sigma factor RsiW